MGAGPDVIKGAVDVSQSATGAAAIVTATLPAVTGKTNYLEGFVITGLGATAATTVDVTIAGLLGGTWTITVAIPAGATTAIAPILVDFGRPRRASGVNTAIVVTVPSFGAGNTKANALAYGYVK